MGLYSIVSQITSKMKKEETTNTRLLGRWVGRVTRIARELDSSSDVEQSGHFLEMILNVATQLSGVTRGDSEQRAPQLAPRAYLRGKKILSEADKTLNNFQPARDGHEEDMRMAMSKDERAMRTILAELDQADDGLLEEAGNLMPTTARPEPQEVTQASPPEPQDTVIPSSLSHSLLKEEQAYIRFERNLAQYQSSRSAHRIEFWVTEMGSEKAEPHAHLIPANYTFCALADTLTNYNDNSFLPDFWSKEVDPTNNCITESGIWWEWQDPSKKVADAISKDGHIGIETVYKSVEYLVVLVKKGESENGMPIDIPRLCRQPALKHLQQQFPGHVVSQVRRLRSKEDVRDVVFDYRSFSHRTNTLFVELTAKST